MERETRRGVGGRMQLLRAPAGPANGVTPDGDAPNAVSRFDTMARNMCTALTNNGQAGFGEAKPKPE